MSVCDKHKAVPAFIYGQCIGCELESLRAEVKHWKANHDDLKRRLAFQTQRPDLPVDRIPAYDLMRDDIDNLIAACCADSPLRMAAAGDLDAAAEYEKRVAVAITISRGGTDGGKVHNGKGANHGQILSNQKQ